MEVQLTPCCQHCVQHWDGALPVNGGGSVRECWVGHRNSLQKASDLSRVVPLVSQFYGSHLIAGQIPEVSTSLCCVLSSLWPSDLQTPPEDLNSGQKEPIKVNYRHTSNFMKMVTDCSFFSRLAVAVY